MEPSMRPSRPADPPTREWPEWVALAEALPADGRLIVIGPSDCGKSTLAWWLAGRLAKRGRPGEVAVVDADVGQARIGPPGCVGWQMLGRDSLEYYFVGATTPERRPASALKATRAAVEAATRAGAAWTVIDTTGYLAGEVGVALKTAKISRLRPAHVVAIGEHPAYSTILSGWEQDVTVHRLPVPPACREKSASRRAAWRQESFSEWLVGCELWWIDAAGMNCLNKPAAELFGRRPEHGEQLRGLLLGFSDDAGRCLGLGLLHTYDFAKDRFLAYCREGSRQAAAVDFGCTRLERDGTQIPRRPRG